MSHVSIGDGEERDYVAYLLRLWRERSGKSTRWRASLQDPHSGERVGFASLEEMFVYLQRETGDRRRKKDAGFGKTEKRA